MKKAIDNPICARLFEKKEVLNGPFKGLRYSSLDAVGSALWPKLLGSYEKELHAIIYSFCRKQYSIIIDIGCAEGYYAIGFARRIPTSKIIAYDTDDKARRLCRKMARLNGVEKRVVIKALCDSGELKEFNFNRNGRGLIISDCEGYESQLFNASNVSNLKRCDLLIETHDFIDIYISTYIANLFSKTHDIIRIKSIDDIEKAKTYSFPETVDLDLNTKKFLYGESRPAIMEWIVCLSKSWRSSQSWTLAQVHSNLHRA